MKKSTFFKPFALALAGLVLANLASNFLYQPL